MSVHDMNGKQLAEEGPFDTADQEAALRLAKARDQVVGELRKVIVGMDHVVDELMIAIFAQGHCLLVGVPGLAKTFLISSLGQALSLSFKRIQFTPDLMPSDITGTELLQEDPVSRQRNFKFLKGPVFANLVLADEINRTPPKTQAALLEAMQEKKVSSGGTDYLLQQPFFVLATQNPIEQEGTYPLPEAQLDRFLFNIMVKYPTKAEEVDIMKRITRLGDVCLEQVLEREDILSFQKLVRKIPVAEHIFDYAANLVRATRPKEEDAPAFVKDWLSWGAGPRASLYLILAGKARAVLRGRYHVSVEDIQAVVHPILRHRIIPNFVARSEGMDTDAIIARLVETIPVSEALRHAVNR